MTDDRDDLVEQVVAAWRPRGLDDGVRSHPAWHDLPDDDRVFAARLASAQRRLEAAMDAQGLSSTGHAVLARIRGG